MPDSVPVAPRVLVWARESALATVAEAAHRTSQTETTILSWEAGQSRPTYSQLERLADEYGISVNVLLLPDRPHLPQPPPDFRSSLGGHEPISRTARRELRRARHLQSLLGEARIWPSPVLPTIPQGREAAEAVRAALGVPMAEQLAWRASHGAFGAWRAALGRLGVVVLQYRLPDAGLKGFSLPATNGGPPVVFVNQGDWINSRIFTLFHELGHLVLARDGGICDPWRPGPTPPSRSVEGRCNRLAGAVLVPSEHLRAQAVVREIVAERDDNEVIRLLNSLGNHYHVSAQVVWYRVHDLGLVSDARFSALWPQLRPPLKKKRPVDELEERTGIPRWRMAKSRYGPQLVSGLLGAIEKGALEPARVMRALNLGTGDLARLQSDRPR